MFYDRNGKIVSRVDKVDKLTNYSNDDNIDAYRVTNVYGQKGLFSKEGHILIPLLYDEIITERTASLADILKNNSYLS